MKRNLFKCMPLLCISQQNLQNELQSVPVKCAKPIGSEFHLLCSTLTLQFIPLYWALRPRKQAGQRHKENPFSFRAKKPAKTWLRGSGKPWGVFFLPTQVHKTWKLEGPREIFPPVFSFYRWSNWSPDPSQLGCDSLATESAMAEQNQYPDLVISPGQCSPHSTHSGSAGQDSRVSSEDDCTLSSGRRNRGRAKHPQRRSRQRKSSDHSINRQNTTLLKAELRFPLLLPPKLS